MNLLKFFRRKERQLFDEMAFVPGLVDTNLRVVCPQAKIDGRLEFVCWACGSPEGIFDAERAIDVPANTGGAWYRVHRRCT